MTQRIVINDCYGGFSLSDDAVALYRAYANLTEKHFYSRDVRRDDPILLKVIDQLGAKYCSGSCANLKVVEIPDGVEWEIKEYDGDEHVAEVHRTWS